MRENSGKEVGGAGGGRGAEGRGLTQLHLSLFLLARTSWAAGESLPLMPSPALMGKHSWGAGILGTICSQNTMYSPALPPPPHRHGCLLLTGCLFCICSPILSFRSLLLLLTELKPGERDQSLFRTSLLLDQGPEEPPGRSWFSFFRRSLIASSVSSTVV